MVNNAQVNVDHGRDFHPLTNHVTKLPRVKCHEFSAFPFSLQLMFDQTLSNLIVCLMISQNNTYNSYTNELACCSGYYVGLIFCKINLKLDS